MGQFYCLYLIAITKFSDMGAYLTGSLIGRHPLVPHISPKKTWEGFFGALGFSLLASLALFKLIVRLGHSIPLFERAFPFRRWPAIREDVSSKQEQCNAPGPARERGETVRVPRRSGG